MLYATASLLIGTTFGVPPLAVFGGVTHGQSFLAKVELCDTGDSRIHRVFSIIPVEVQTPNAYGFGIDPVGLNVRLGATTHLVARGGLRFFTRSIPIPKGQRFNFTADVGFQWRAVGLTLHHVSNGGLARRNPGINFLMLTWRKEF